MADDNSNYVGGAVNAGTKLAEGDVIGAAAAIVGSVASWFGLGGGKADKDRQRKIDGFINGGGKEFNALLVSITQQGYMSGAVARAGVPMDNMMAAIQYWTAQYGMVNNASLSLSDRADMIDWLVDGTSPRPGINPPYGLPFGNFSGGGVMKWVQYALPIVIAEYHKTHPVGSVVSGGGNPGQENIIVTDPINLDGCIAVKPPISPYLITAIIIIVAVLAFIFLRG